MNYHEFSCRSCGVIMSCDQRFEYVRCGRCGSYNYISENPADVDNENYFDSFYSSYYLRPLFLRSLLYNFFLRVYNFFHLRQVMVFERGMRKVKNLIVESKATLEVGFGSGSEMVKFLSLGANMFGRETSKEAVNNFILRYPKYADRVSMGKDDDNIYDVVYSNALFEHLDAPYEFLEKIDVRLSKGGLLITKLPLVSAGSFLGRERYDINFWKPCHRALYTEKGLRLLFKKHGFTIRQVIRLKYYGYRVMSAMMKQGYEDIEKVRNPVFPIRGLSFCSYLMCLFKGFFYPISCEDSIVFAIKSNKCEN